MFFFVVGNSRETLAASIVISITFWCISTASQRWTFDPAGTVAVVLGLAVPALLLLVRSVVTRSLLSHVASALSRSFFGARGNLRAGVAAQPIDVLPRLQALPIEHWRPAASLSVSELRRRLMQRGGVAEPRALLERTPMRAPPARTPAPAIAPRRRCRQRSATAAMRRLIATVDAYTTCKPWHRTAPQRINRLVAGRSR